MKLLTSIIILSLFLSPAHVQGYTPTEYVTPPESAHTQDTHTVARVIDGDILELENGERVRLIGIDCPEIEYSTEEATYLNKGKKWERGPEDLQHAQEAREFTKNLVEDREVRLEFDVEHKDKYGRLLAYVWYEIAPYSHLKDMVWADYYEVDVNKWKNKQGYYGSFVFLNATIIKAGYASPMTIPPNVKHVDLFQKLYQEAQENKRGLWKDITAATCPVCGAKDGVRIIYGLPGRELMEKAKRGEIVLGGCIVTGNDPQWVCKTCDHRWGEFNPEDF